MTGPQKASMVHNTLHHLNLNNKANAYNKIDIKTSNSRAARTSKGVFILYLNIRTPKALPTNGQINAMLCVFLFKN